MPETMRSKGESTNRASNESKIQRAIATIRCCSLRLSRIRISWTAGALAVAGTQGNAGKSGQQVALHAVVVAGLSVPSMYKPVCQKKKRL